MRNWVPFAQRKWSKAARTRGNYSQGHPRGLVVHYTGGAPHAKLYDSIDWQHKRGYTYFIIDEHGNLAQNFPLNEWGYHAGDSQKYPSKWPSLGFGVSKHLVGVEICCPGALNDNLAPYFNPNKPYPVELCRKVAAVANMAAGWYYKYTPEQEATLVRLCRWLKTNAPDVFDFDLVLGHDEVSGPRGIGWRRKSDPGGSLSLTMDDFREALHGLRPGALATMEAARPSEPSIVSGLEPDTAPEVRPFPVLTFRSLAKRDWFHVNKASLQAIVAMINNGGDETPLTMSDVFGLLNAELALDSDGRVDENGVHSLGETGPLPLPKSIRYWVPEASKADARRSPTQNVFDFLRYLHAVKNKDVGRTLVSGEPLYCGLFRLPEVRDDERAQARILAAVIHGWFLPSNYTLRLPNKSIAAATLSASSDLLASIIHDLGFKHGTELLTNRLDNLDEGLDLV